MCCVMRMAASLKPYGAHDTRSVTYRVDSVRLFLL